MHLNNLCSAMQPAAAAAGAAALLSNGANDWCATLLHSNAIVPMAAVVPAADAPHVQLYLLSGQLARMVRPKQQQCRECNVEYSAPYSSAGDVCVFYQDVSPARPLPYRFTAYNANSNHTNGTACACKLACRAEFTCDFWLLCL